MEHSQDLKDQDHDFYQVKINSIDQAFLLLLLGHLEHLVYVVDRLNLQLLYRNQFR